MDYLSIIKKYYPQDDALRQLLLKHSRQVADRCLQIVRKHKELPVDVQFLEEAAMLHDIGIYQCDAPSICCTGTEPYIRHGQIGGQLLRDEGYPRHARVAERHTGTGLPGWNLRRWKNKSSAMPTSSSPSHTRNARRRWSKRKEASPSLEKKG